MLVRIWAAILSFFLVCLPILTGPVSARDASESQVTVIKTSGDVRVDTDTGEEKALKRGDLLYPGWTIQTGGDGLATLRLMDSSRIEIYENSSVAVNDVLQEETGSSFSIFLGHIKFNLQKLIAPEIVHTPTMVAGVRGTDFTVTVAEDGASVVSVAEGEVDVATEEEGTQKGDILLKTGQEVELLKPGEALNPRERRLKNIEQVREYRRKRLEELIPQLPSIVEKMNGKINPSLTRLEGIKDAIVKKVDHIAELLGEAKKLKDQDGFKSLSVQEKRRKVKELMEKRQALITELRKEKAALKGLGKAYRFQVARLMPIFARSRRLQNVMPKLKEQLGSDYERVQKGLGETVSREPEVRRRVKAMSADIQEAFKKAGPGLRALMRKKQS